MERGEQHRDVERGNTSYIDVLAPGVNVIYAGLGTSNYVSSSEQTSVATPHVTALGALLKQINPDLNTSDIRTILQNTGSSVTDNAFNPARTYKRIDVDGAIAQAFSQTPAGTRGTFNDIEYDSSGNLHMAWFNSSALVVLYAKRSAGSSFGATQVIDAGAAFGGASESTNGIGSYVTIALDTSVSPAVPAVAYYDSSNADLRYARQSGSTWNREIVDSTNTVGLYPSLAFNGATAGISYYYSNLGNLRLAEKISGSWTSNLIDGSNEAGRFSRLAVHAGSPDWAVVYEEFVGGGTTYAKYAERTGSTWTATQVELLNQTVAYTDLDFDSSNRPAFTYYDSANGDLHFARYNGSTWGTNVVAANGTVGLHTNLWWDAGDSVWEIVYYKKSGIETVLKIRGVLNNWGTPRTLLQGGGANLSAAWKTDGSLSFTGLPTGELDLDVWEGTAD